MKKILISLIVFLLVVGCGSKSVDDKKVSSKKNDSEVSVPSEYNDSGIFKDYYEAAYKKLSSMNIDEKIGQMLLVRMDDTKVDSIINDYHVAVFVMFARDFKDNCEYNHIFYMVGNNKRNLWFYSIVGSYPVDYYKDSDKRRLNLTDNKFIDWVNDSNYKCLVYYFDGDDLLIDDSKFIVLYKNNSGVILKKK